MKIISATPLPPEMLAAVAYCMGDSLNMTAANCREHFSTDFYDSPTGHGGLDCICGLAKDHENRHKCVRCGREISNG